MNQNFEDFDDDTGSYDRASEGLGGDCAKCLKSAIDIIATAPNMPLSAAPRIDRDQIIDLLESALQKLPDELREARWMIREREEFIARTHREADEVIEAAKIQAERFVQRSEVVRAAEQRARQISEAADEDSRRRRNATEDFLDQRLASFEILLDKLSKTVATGRRRLAIGDVQDGKTNMRDEDLERNDFADQSGAIFFDQDNTSTR